MLLSSHFMPLDPHISRIKTSVAKPIGESKSIWLVTARVGAGHVQAARAVEEALVARGLGNQIRYIDLMEHVSPWFRRIYAGGYAGLASRCPGLYGVGYDLSDRSHAPWPTPSEKLRSRLDAWSIRSLKDQLFHDAPDWIVHTHFLSPAPMGRWIRQYGLPSRQAVVVTDLHPHRIWLADPVERYFVGADSARETLASRGIDRDRVQVSGIPILAKHRRAVDWAATYTDFNWPTESPVLLLLAGSDFVIGPIETVADRLLESFPHVTVQIATGRNEELHRRLLAKQSRHPNLRLVGYTDRMNELLARATIVLSKTGGITTSECLAHGAAMLGLFPVPGQEELNADYLVAHQAGMKLKKVEEVVPAVRRLLHNAVALATMKASAARLGRVRAADAIADTLVGSLTNTYNRHSRPQTRVAY